MQGNVSPCLPLPRFARPVPLPAPAKGKFLPRPALPRAWLPAPSRPAPSRPALPRPALPPNKMLAFPLGMVHNGFYERTP